MTTVSKDLLKALRVDINNALKAVGEKHGVSLRACNASFTPNTFHYKLEGAMNDVSGNAVDPVEAQAALDYKCYAEAYGLKTEWLGKLFSVGGQEMTLIGFMPKRRKFPILAKTKAGKHILLPLEVSGMIWREEG